jgi:FixJ family two-component response regulator
MMGPATVFVVDDDVSVRRALARLLKSSGLHVEALASAEELLARPLTEVPACIVLDVRMPGLSGLDAQRALAQRDGSPPIVCISGQADIPMSVLAMKAGAVDFLPKPFNDENLLAAVRQGLERHVRAQQTKAEQAEVRRRAELLSPREREVLALVVSGMINKQAGQKLGVTEKTIKVHRARVMQKMGAGSLAELVRMAEKIGVSAPPLLPPMRPSERAASPAEERRPITAVR